MAQITEVFELEFDSTSFEAGITSAIQRLEDLTAAAEDAAVSTEDLDAAQSDLIGSLKTEATGIDGLNSKRNVLVKTQQNLNSESKSYTAVGSEVANTNTKIAKTTAGVATKQKGLFSGLVSGAKKMNSLRRAASLLNGVFRVLGGVSLFGVVLAAGSAISRFFTNTKKEVEEVKEATVDLDKATQDITKSYLNETKELDNLFGALNEANKAGTDKSAIISEIQSKYGDYIGNINLETAGQNELEIAYRRASEAILDRILVEAKAAAARQIIQKIIDRQIESANQEAATAKATTAAIKEQEEQIARLGEQGEKARVNFEALGEAAKAIGAGETKKDTADLKDELNNLNDAFANIEKNVKAAILEAVDFNTLTGQFEAKAKTANKSVQVLSGSIAALEKDLSDLNTQLRQQTAVDDPAALAAIQSQIDAQQKRVEAAKKVLADLAGIEKAESNIEKLKTALITDESNRRIEVLRQAAQKEKDEVVGSEEQKSQQILLINERLARDVQDVRQKSIDDTIKASEEESARAAALRQDIFKTEFESIRLSQSALLSIRLQGIEERRNAALKVSEDIEATNKAFDNERIEAEKQTQAVLLQAEIESVDNIIAVRERLGLSTQEQVAAVEELKLKLVELGRTEPDIKTDKAKNKIKEFILETLPLIQGVSDSVFDAVGQGYQRLIDRLDDAVNRSKTALDDIRADSENFNARQLALEKERLENLENERERTLGLIQLTTNSLIAISKAAAEGGAAAPFTIASTLIALISGFAAARAASGSAFFEGSEFVDREAKHGHGRDQVPARLNRGERVITTEKNAKYFPVLSAIHNGKIPASDLNGFASNYLSGAGHNASILKEVGGNPILIGRGGNNAGLESRMERIEDAILNLPKYMPGVTVTANGRGIFKTIESRKQGMNTAKKIAGR